MEHGYLSILLAEKVEHLGTDVGRWVDVRACRIFFLILFIVSGSNKQGYNLRVNIEKVKQYEKRKEGIK